MFAAWTPLPLTTSGADVVFATTKVWAADLQVDIDADRGQADRLNKFELLRHRQAVVFVRVDSLVNPDAVVIVISHRRSKAKYVCGSR
jgi:hypothetical protein